MFSWNTNSKGENQASKNFTTLTEEGVLPVDAE